MKNLLLIVVVMATVGGPGLFAGRKYAPMPAKLLSAKTAFVINEGAWSKAFDKFYVELEKWGRFRLVENKEQADIVIGLSSGPSGASAAVLVPGTSAVVAGGFGSNFFLRITDAKDNTPLWSDSSGEAVLVSNSAKVFVSTLRKRMERK